MKVTYLEGRVVLESSGKVVSDGKVDRQLEEIVLENNETANHISISFPSQVSTRTQYRCWWHCR